MKLLLDKMFALDKAFMFRFEAEPGEPENTNHKIIPTYRALRLIGQPKIQEMMRHFLSREDIDWKPFDPQDYSALGTIYHPKSDQRIGISPCTLRGRYIVWVMTIEDIEEINGTTPDGNHRNTIR